MGLLRISLLGGLRVSHDDFFKETRLTPSSQTLFAFLLLQRNRLHPREVLAGQLWGNNSQEHARGCLNTALWRLRRVLEPAGIPTGTYIINNLQGEVGFNKESKYWLDIEVFDQQISQALNKHFQEISLTEVVHLEKTLELYQGDLIENIFEDWALRDRERMRSLYLNCLAYLIDYYQYHGLYEKGLEYGRLILDIDPLREEIHRKIMRLYAANGQRTLAVRQFTTCRAVLAKELGIPPMEETENLYNQIIAGADAFEHLLAQQPDVIANLQQSIEQLNQMAQVVDHLRKSFQEVILNLEQIENKEP
jgi:DNA-binding SARP family transcriptional activator